MYIRKSMIKTFKTCPLKFKYEYIDKEPLPPGFTYSQAIQFGTDFHEQVYRFFDDVDMKHIERIGNDVEELKDYFLSLLPSDPEYHFFAEFEAKRYVAYEKKYYWQPILREETVTSHQLQLTGTIDRVDILEPGVYVAFGGQEIVLRKPTPVIIDYKTGTWSYNNPSEMRFELSFYAMLLKHSKTHIVTNIGGGIFPTVQAAHLYKLSSLTFKSTEQKIQKLREAIQKGEFERKPSAACDWCPYIEKCFGGDIDEFIQTLGRDKTENTRAYETSNTRKTSRTKMSELWQHGLPSSDGCVPPHIDDRPTYQFKTHERGGLLAHIRETLIHLQEMWRGG